MSTPPVTTSRPTQGESGSRTSRVASRTALWGADEGDDHTSAAVPSAAIEERSRWESPAAERVAIFHGVPWPWAFAPTRTVISDRL